MSTGWAAAGTFSAAVDGLRRSPFRPVFDISEMAEAARVIVFPRRQVEAIPTLDHDHAAAMAVDLRAPFDVTYLSLGPVPTFEGDDREDMETLGAFVVGDDDGRVGEVYPVIRSGGHVAQYGAMVPRQAGLDGYDEAGWRLDSTERLANLGGYTGDPEAEDSCFQATGMSISAAVAISTVCRGAEQAIRAIYLLECANVTVAPPLLPRQQRRAAARAGARIALAVHISPPRRRPNRATPNAAARFTHRFEVRGHFKHFAAGTRIADAATDKLVNHPTIGPCRRIWCPPFVKGPEHLPLVPKVRTSEIGRTAPDPGH